jgi:glycine cleavage system aminomethyltransferase T
MSRTTKTIAALAALAVVALGITGVAGAAGAKTTVTIKEDAPGDFRGKVKSSKAKCVDGRKVVVFKQKGSDPEPRSDEKIATDTADADGRWSVGNTGDKGGKHYAKAPRRPGCKADLSPTI